MKKIAKTCAALLLCCVLLTSCFTTTHVVGSGGSSGQTSTKKQWFALWGAVPITNVTSQQMAAGATDYTIITTFSFADKLIGLFTGIVTIYPMTVTVKK